MKFIKKYWLYATLVLVIIFATYQTVKAYKLDKKLKATENELSDAEDKLDAVRSKLSDLQSRVSDLQSSISDLYQNRSFYNIEDVESEADDLSNDIEATENEADE